MGGYQHVQKPLTTSPPPQQVTNHHMLYYGIMVLATATIVLAIYHLIIVRWCTIQYHRHLQQQQRRRANTTSNTMSPPSSSLSAVCLVSSFKYNRNQLVEYNDTECSVCLSVFEEGEEVKKLPMCDHCFHASCIDMWLYSHIHCPLCRAPVAPPLPLPGRSAVLN